MAVYKVLRPIEHSMKLFTQEHAPGPPRAVSAANGAEIPVDKQGYIELTEAEAALLTMDQILKVGIKPPGKKGK